MESAMSYDVFKQNFEEEITLSGLNLIFLKLYRTFIINIEGDGVENNDKKISLALMEVGDSDWHSESKICV